jgi:hypothetical protein|tara:strand:- start:231 stop:383 length:153 start_codon:yes stop_codon:yes gene_type:complete
MNKLKKILMNIMISGSQEKHEPFYMKWQFYSFLVIPGILLILHYYFEIDI